MNIFPPFVLIFWFTSHLIVTDCVAAEPRTLSIASWNLEWYFDEYSGDNNSDLAKQQTAPSRAAWNWKRDAVADAIAKLAVDVIGLQEIENGRVLWYTTRAIERNHQQDFQIAFSEGSDVFTEQDVGFLYRNIDAIKFTRHLRPLKVDKSTDYFDVTKHLEFEFLVDSTNSKERVVVINLHLRSRPEGAEFRQRQARLIRHWIDDRIATDVEVIVLGDTNSEFPADNVPNDSELGILLGRSTAKADDDLVDLHTRIPAGKRQTHLIPDRQFDRILVTCGLLEDDPRGLDLVLSEVQVRSDVCVRGEGPDDPEQHFDEFWKLADDQRDISDHYPVVARFEIR